MRKRVEILTRVIRISLLMAVTILAGCAAPQTFWAFKEQSRKQWRTAISDWRKKACIGVEHTKGRTIGGFRDFAQSFVPGCKKIEVVELCTYPVKAPGWIRVDIAQDEEGSPGRRLSRCWLRIQKDCAVPHSGYVTFDVPNVKVKPKGIYWVTFNEYVDEEYMGRESTGCVTNTGYSRANTYQEGKLLVGSWQGIHERGDVKFRIISKCDSVPTLRKASRCERESLPRRDFQNASWADASIKRNKYVLKKREAQQESLSEK